MRAEMKLPGVALDLEPLRVKIHGMASVKTVDEYIQRQDRWGDEVAKLREILLATGLEEAVKWGAPAYMVDGKNLVGIASFKSYFGLWFFQGALLSDPDGVLASAPDSKAKAMRQWRFESMKQVKAKAIKAYVREAIELHRSGAEIKPDRSKPLEMPAELQAALRARPKAAKAFSALTPGKQRDYATHIAEAKREATKASRLQKILPMIEAGVGLHDKYRNC